MLALRGRFEFRVNSQILILTSELSKIPTLIRRGAGGEGHLDRSNGQTDYALSRFFAPRGARRGSSRSIHLPPARGAQRTRPRRVADRRSPHLPFTVHSSRFTAHCSPFTVHASRVSILEYRASTATPPHSPITIHHSRLTIHGSQFTVHCSRFTIHDSRCSIARIPCPVFGWMPHCAGSNAFLRHNSRNRK